MHGRLAQVGERRLAGHVADVAQALGHQPAVRPLHLFAVQHDQHHRHGEPLALQIAQSDRGLDRNVRQDRDHRGVAGDARADFQRELGERHAVGQLDAGQQFANALELLAAAASRHL